MKLQKWLPICRIRHLVVAKLLPFVQFVPIASGFVDRTLSPELFYHQSTNKEHQRKTLRAFASLRFKIPPNHRQVVS